MLRLCRTLMVPFVLAGFLLAQPAQPAFTAAGRGHRREAGARRSPWTWCSRTRTASRSPCGTLIDKPTILTLNYFRCAGICTPQLNGVVDVLNETQAEPGKDFQVLTVSFDPRDTPEIAAQKRANYLKRDQAPLPAGRLALPHRGRGRPPRPWPTPWASSSSRRATTSSTPAAIIFLCPKGEVTRYMYGVTLPARRPPDGGAGGRPGRGPAHHQQVAATSASATIPQGRRYVFSITRTAAMVIIFWRGGLRAGPGPQEDGGRRQTTKESRDDAQPSYLVDTGARKGLAGLAHLHRPQAHRPPLPLLPW